MYNSRNKSDLKRHFQRKMYCEVEYDDISISNCITLLNNNKLKKKKSKKHECECGKVYDRMCRLDVHKEKCNFDKNKVDKLEETVKKLQDQINQITTNSNTGINNSDINSHNNITNNITINAFKDMDYNLLKDEILLCLENQDPKLQVPAFEKIIDAVHFNKDNPSNHNIYKPNVRDDRILTFNGDDFVVDKMAIDIILKKLEEVIENSIDKENGKVYLKKLKNHLKLKQEDNDYHEATKDDIAVGLYNGRKIVTSTHKNLK
jgi:hypothetical protein